jgi:acyl dehydratase
MSERVRVGDQRLSKGRTVTDADVVIWAGLVHDFTSLHMDAELMRTSFFGRTIAHGYIAMTMSVGLFFPEDRDFLRPTGLRTVGWDEVRFERPVHVGDTLRCRRTVVAVTDQLLVHRVEVLNQDNAVVMSGQERFAFVV